jgi:hypothetical protein
MLSIKSNTVNLCRLPLLRPPDRLQERSEPDLSFSAPSQISGISRKPSMIEQASERGPRSRILDQNVNLTDCIRR